MKFIGILFVFFGYVLVYASTAAGGKFATEPWASLFADAYTDAKSGGSQASGSTPNWSQVASNTLGGTFTPLSSTPSFTRPRVNLPQTTPYSGTHGGSYGAQP